MPLTWSLARAITLKYWFSSNLSVKTQPTFKGSVLLSKYINGIEYWIEKYNCTYLSFPWGWRVQIFKLIPRKRCKTEHSAWYTLELTFVCCIKYIVYWWTGALNLVFTCTCSVHFDTFVKSVALWIWIFWSPIFF